MIVMEFTCGAAPPRRLRLRLFRRACRVRPPRPARRRPPRRRWVRLRGRSAPDARPPRRDAPPAVRPPPARRTRSTRSSATRSIPRRSCGSGGGRPSDGSRNGNRPRLGVAHTLSKINRPRPPLSPRPRRGPCVPSQTRSHRVRPAVLRPPHFAKCQKMVFAKRPERLAALRGVLVECAV